MGIEPMEAKVPVATTFAKDFSHTLNEVHHNLEKVQVHMKLHVDKHQSQAPICKENELVWLSMENFNLRQTRKSLKLTE